MRVFHESPLPGAAARWWSRARRWARISWVVRVEGPAVGAEDGFVDDTVNVGGPRGALVVELGEWEVLEAGFFG